MADGATLVGSKAALPAFKSGEGAGIRKFNINSNVDPSRNVNIATGVMNFTYYESLLQDVVRATVAFTDTGNSVEGKSVMEGLPVYGSETTEIEIKDNNSNTLNLRLYVNKPDDLLDDTRKKLTTLNFASKEYFKNEKIRLNTRFDGLISNSVETILTAPEDQSGQGGGSLGSTTQRGGVVKFLDTEKELFIEASSNKRNFIGNNWKPFYTINWLAGQAIPTGEANPDAMTGESTNEAANSAGFMFWETADGFHFKSIDGLFNKQKNQPKRRFIYNETAEGACSANMPEGYDAKALEMSLDNRTDVQKKMMMGAFTTRTWLFNPYTAEVTFIYPNAGNSTGTEDLPSVANQEDLQLMANNLPVFNREFDHDTDFTLTQFRVMDVGTLPEGTGSGENSQQVQESKVDDKKYENTLNQGNMRVNQLFAFKVKITIPGDFALRAGDMVYFDAPGLREEKIGLGNDAIDHQISGHYIIGSLCHYLDGGNTLTRLDLIRDSFGREAQDRNSSASISNLGIGANDIPSLSNIA